MMSMKSNTTAGEDVQRSAGQPAQQNVSSDAPAEPAFKMPDPPKTKTMAPPPPRFSAAPQQTSASSREQASAPGSTSDIGQAKPHAISERPAEPSSNAPEIAEGEAAALLRSPATAKGLPQPVARTVDKARMAGIAAAAAAAAHVTPGQREKAVADAAAAAYAANQAEEEKASSAPAAASADTGPPRDASTYTPPDWAGPPTGLDYTLEVMKNGQIVETRSVSGRDSFTFGRTPGSDFVLEHPSASRLHAVLQYRGTDGQAFLYDAASAHGTFLNKKQIPSKTHVPLRVGDMFKFGRSTRMYILGGPTELMPEEGLTKKQMLTMKALEAKEARKEREAQVAKVQMEAALHSGVSWGMAGDDQDPEDEDEAAALSVDWRAYSQTHTLTDKQQKLAEKIRKRENRIGALQKEVDKIRAKQKAMEELTQGQAMTLVRNDQVIDRSAEEAEDLEEMLNESISDSLRGAKQRASGQGTEKKQRKRKKRDLEEEEAEGASSGEDEFYDRTMETKKKRSKAAAHVEDAASLYGRKEALLEERKRLEAGIQKELKGKGAATDGPAGPAASQAAAAADSSSGEAAAAADAQEDALDAFMNDVQHQIEEDKVATLQKEMADIDKQVAEAERMLKFADPDGYYREGTHAAEMAKTKGIRALKIEKQRQEAEAKQRRELQGRKQQEAAFVPEVEEEDPQDKQLAGGMHQQPGQATQPGAQATVQQQQQQSDAHAQGMTSAGEHPLADSSAATDAPEDEGGSAAAAAPAEAAAPPPLLLKQVMQHNPHRLAAEDPQQGGLQLMKKPSQLLTREQLKAQKAAEVAKAKTIGTARAGGAHAASGILADLALLQGADDSGGRAEDGDGTERWKPPEDQKGDGRTKLNDLLGY